MLIKLTQHLNTIVGHGYNIRNTSVIKYSTNNILSK